MDYPLSLDQYEIISIIGRGATAEVFVAKCKSNNKFIAMKLIDLESCPIEIETVHHEVAFWRSSKNENIVDYYGSFIDGHVLYLLMEYMSAGSCYEIMKYGFNKGINNEMVIASILFEVLKALDYLHDHHQIHRDIKAGNILINENGCVKIADFGIAANLLEKGQRKRARFTLIGTPCYMAPEILKSDGGSGHNEKADIWSLGITAIELALGAAPYSNLYPVQAITKIMNNPPPQLPEGSEYSSTFKDFIRQCLNPSPEDRPSAKDLLSHKFIKQVKESKSVLLDFISEFPPLPERYSQLHKTAVTINPTKTEPIIEWDFNTESSLPKSTTVEQNLLETNSVTITQENNNSLQSPESLTNTIPNSSTSQIGKFTITKHENKPQPEDKPKSESEQILEMENTVSYLQQRIESLKLENRQMKQQLDQLSGKVQVLLH